MTAIDNANEFRRGARKNRGANHREKAVQFSMKFPVGCRLTPAEFDEWAEEQGYYQVPRDVSRDSNEWLGHIQRRHALKTQLFMAGCHSAMIALGREPFVIAILSQGDYGLWEVRDPQTELEKMSIVEPIRSLSETITDHLRYLSESLPANLAQEDRDLLNEIHHRSLEMLHRIDAELRWERTTKERLFAKIQMNQALRGDSANSSRFKALPELIDDGEE